MPASLQWHQLTAHLQPHQKFAVPFYISTIIVSFLYSVLGHAPVSYFTHKRNLFNVLFVKLGWFWTTVVYLFYLYNVLSRRESYERGLFRYAMATWYWYILTQWLLGPSLIERVFVATGGHCVDDNMMTVQNVYQQAMCRRLGGTWDGGHDVSGHCVLLIHSSLFLWEEIKWTWYSIPMLERLKQVGGWPWRSVLAVFALLTLWWWMLVVTSVYFHGHFELLSGCILGIAGWALLYLGLFPRLPSVGTPPVRLDTR